MYCSTICKNRAYMRRKGLYPRPRVEASPKIIASPLRYGNCKQCGTTIIVRGNRRYCSEECSYDNLKARMMELYEAAIKVRDVPQAMHWHRRLCTHLAQRDGGNCGICGKPVEIHRRSGTRGGKDQNLGPSIDHIVPRSKGGTNDLTNLRLTHWGCNRKRGNRGGPEQLRLVA